jgi:hypothetical protein
MHSLTPPAQLSPEQRRAELSGILAAALLRMRGRKGYVPPEMRDGPSTLEQSTSRATGAGVHAAPHRNADSRAANDAADAAGGCKKGSKLPAENSRNPLDVPVESRLSVHPQLTNPSGKDTDR